MLCPYAGTSGRRGRRRWRQLDKTTDMQIKKNTAPHELKPSDILIERFTAWKQIVKMLIGTYHSAPLAILQPVAHADD